MHHLKQKEVPAMTYVENSLYDDVFYPLQDDEIVIRSQWHVSMHNTSNGMSKGMHGIEDVDFVASLH
jgi:hypothetical protein